MPKIKLKHPEKFAQQLIDGFLAGGFGSLSKKETELLILELLEANEGFEDMSNHSAALKLGFSEMRLRSLRYELAQRKYADSPKYFAKKLLPCLEKTRFEKEKGNGKIVFAVEDKFIRLSLAAKFKDMGSFADGSFNSEIMRMDSAVFFKVVNTIYTETQCLEALTKLEKEIKRTDESRYSGLWKGFLKVAGNFVVSVGTEYVQNQIFKK